MSIEYLKSSFNLPQTFSTQVMCKDDVKIANIDRSLVGIIKQEFPVIWFLSKYLKR